MAPTPPAPARVVRVGAGELVGEMSGVAARPVGPGCDAQVRRGSRFITGGGQGVVVSKFIVEPSHAVVSSGDAQLDPVVRGVCQILLGSEVAFGRLN